MQPYSFTIKEASEKLAKGEISSVELTQSVLVQAKNVEPKIGAYITLCEEKALEMAQKSDKQYAISHNRISPLDGIPIAVKDLFLTKDIKTTAGSKILEDFIPAYESTVTTKLWEAGAVLVGKTNLDQFAMGSSTETSVYKTATNFDSTTRNPWDTDRIPGGSSGGSAVAVAADECIAAVGTDTGGSIRQPASHCSVTGLKPTYGRVSRYGIMAMASSLDQAGPITKTVEDSSILLKYISGYDRNDSTSSKNEVGDYHKNLQTDLKGVRVGIPKEFFAEGLDPRIGEIIRDQIKVLESLGAKTIEVSLPMIHYALAVYYILMPAEVSSNLARYDGIHYGSSILKSEELKQRAHNLLDVYNISRAGGFGAEAKRRIMLGSYVLSAGYYDSPAPRARPRLRPGGSRRARSPSRARSRSRGTRTRCRPPRR